MADEPGGATPADGEFASYDEVEPAPSSSNVAVAPPDDAYDTYEMPTAATTGGHQRILPSYLHRKIMWRTSTFDFRGQPGTGLHVKVILRPH